MVKLTRLFWNGNLNETEIFLAFFDSSSPGLCRCNNESPPSTIVTFKLFKKAQWNSKQAVQESVIAEEEKTTCRHDKTYR